MTKLTVVLSAIWLTLILHVISAATTSLATAAGKPSAAEHDNAKKAINNRLQTTIVAFGGAYKPDHQMSVDLIVLKKDDDGNNSYTTKSGTRAPGIRFEFASAVVNDTVYVISGRKEDDHAAFDLWSYNIVNDSWNAQGFPASPIAAIGGSAVALDGKIYVTSGEGVDTNRTDVYAFDVASSTWSKCRGEHPHAGYYMSCLVAQNQSLLYFDGQHLFRSDDKADSWQKAPHPSTKDYRFYMACTTLGSDAMIMTGGYGDVDETDTNSVRIFNLTTNSWKAAAPMHYTRYHHSAATMPDGKHVLVCGGVSDSHLFIAGNLCEIYDSVADQWTVTNFRLPHDRSTFGLVVSQTKGV